TGRAQQQDRRRRTFGDEGERAVGVHGNDHRNHQTLHRLRLRVEGLTELHDVDPALAERGTHRRRRIRRTGGEPQPYLTDDFLRHLTAFRCGASHFDTQFHPNLRGARGYDRRATITRPGRARPPAGYDFSTCTKSSSTGVARPKIEISTRTLPFSGRTSSTVPLKSWKGPSTTLIDSPTSKRTLGLGRSAPSCI